MSFVTGQLGVERGVLADYRKRPATRSQHLAWACAHLGLRPFGRADEERLVAFIGEKVAHTANSAALLDAAEDWLVRQGVLRPAGETTIERLVYGARARAEEQLFGSIADSLSAEEKDQLDALCATDDGESARRPRRGSAPATWRRSCGRGPSVLLGRVANLATVGFHERSDL